MKKLLMRLACMMLALTMILSFAACDKDDEDKEEKKSKSEVSDTVDEEDEKKTEEKKPVVNDDAADAVRDYVESQAAAVEEALTNDMMVVDIYAEGTTVVYDFRIQTIPEATADAKAQAKEGYESIADSMKDSLEMMQDEEPAVKAIRVEYRAANGDMLYTGITK